jgi:hypothetical protein
MRYGLLRAGKTSRMRLGIKPWLGCALLAFVAISVSATETVTLRNGYSIQFDRRELRGDWTRLYVSASPDDFVDVRTEEIVGFEPEGLAPIVPAPRTNDSNVIDVDEAVISASAHTNLSPDLLRSVIRVESGFNPNAVSRKGAQGLMQLMPDTAARMGVRNSFNPSENVEGGARYLHELLGLFHNDVVKALAAYNAGPQKVQQYHGVPPYKETVAYVNKVIRDFNQAAAFPQKAAGSYGDPFRRESAKDNGATRRKTGALIGDAGAPARRDFERHPLSIN